MSDHHRHYQTTADFRPRQFRIEVHEREVEDLKRRLRETRWPVHFSDRDGDADGDVELGWDYGESRGSFPLFLSTGRGGWNAGVPSHVN